MPAHRFVLEAEIDAGSTHVMVPERIDEYLEYERLKHSLTKDLRSIDVVRAEMKRGIEQRRLVIAFRNAREIDGQSNHSGKNPVWYSE